mgnify:CR=1 FL=1
MIEMVVTVFEKKIKASEILDRSLYVAHKSSEFTWPLNIP